MKQLRLRIRATTTRHGYTLVEMIIAMVLVSALMSSVWTIMSLYNGLLTAGRDRTTEQQLVRSLFELVNEDLYGINTTADAPLMPEFGDTLDDFSAGDTSGNSSAFPDELTTENTIADVSLSGTSTAIRLRIRTFQPPDFSPPSDIDLLNELGGGSIGSRQTNDAVSEFQTVIYQIVSPNRADAVNSAAVNLLPGLYRIQVDTASLSSLEAGESTAEQQRRSNSVELSRQTLTLLTQTADESARGTVPDVARRDMSVPQSKIDHVPEVMNCRFEYFDGTSWMSTWSSDQLQPVPAAVRVSFDVTSMRELLETADTSVDAVANGSSALADQSLEVFPVISARSYSRTILLDATSGETL